MNKRELILESIIKEYIRSNEPVGSSQLQMKLSFDISASTIRVYFKRLVDEGVLRQLHISSGRVPTHDALKKYWSTKLDTDQVLNLRPKETLQMLSQDFSIYCMANFSQDENLEEVIAVSNKYILLVFGDVQVSYEYNEHIYNYLKGFIGVSAQKIAQLCFSVGLVKLSSKIENAFEFEKNFSLGSYVLYEMMKDARDENSLDMYQSSLEKRDFLDLQNGLYFDTLVPQGYMLLKQDVNIDNKRANFTCIGNLCSDFESFFEMAQIRE